MSLLLKYFYMKGVSMGLKKKKKKLFDVKTEKF